MGPLEKAARAICALEIDNMRAVGRHVDKNLSPDTLCRAIASPGPRGTEVVSSSYAAIQATLKPLPAWIFCIAPAASALDAAGVIYNEESEVSHALDGLVEKVI